MSDSNPADLEAWLDQHGRAHDPYVPVGYCGPLDDTPAGRGPVADVQLSLIHISEPTRPL